MSLAIRIEVHRGNGTRIRMSVGPPVCRGETGRWNMNETDEKLFREFERQLDEHHRSLALWERRRPEAIYALMTIPDAVYLILMVNPSPPNLTGGFAQKFKRMEEGVGQAVRWLTGDGCTTIQSVADHDLIEQAHQFSIYASDYVDIADFHMMCGRGSACASVDATSKTITFESIEGPGQSDVLAWHEDAVGQRNRGVGFARRMTPSGVSRAQDAFQDVEYELADGRIQLGELPHDLVDRARETLCVYRELELSRNAK